MSITQEYDAAGKPQRFSAEYEPDEPSVAIDASRYNIRIWALAKGSPGRSDFEQNLIENGLFTLRIYLQQPVQQPGMLAFARGNYINIDLGLAKFFMPEAIEKSGYLEAIDTLAHWRAFAEGEASLNWSIHGVQSYSDIGETGEFPLSAFDSGLAALAGFAAEIGNRDLRMAESSSLRAQCS